MGKALTLLALLIVAGAIYAAAQYRGIPFEPGDIVPLWQSWANPGPLAAAHARLHSESAACHTPLLGPDPAKCTACHADNRGLLQRQSTAFHADVGTCRECHLEHLGRQYVARRMDHVALGKIGERKNPPSTEPSLRQQIASAFQRAPPTGRPDNPLIRPEEVSLDCAACHNRRDRHQGQFGTDCATCHATASWRIAGYVHPSTNSTDCAQCHLEPPGRRMMHFETVSKVVAGQEHAAMRQCFLCHQTTSWNDIKGVGWYKHH